jgi:hypothetical protein
MTNSDLPAVPALEPMTLRVADTEERPFTIALVIDNVLYQKMKMDGKQAAMFLANPTFVQIAEDSAFEGQIYDPATGTFSSPA